MATLERVNFHLHQATRIFDLAQCRPSAIKILRTIALCACHRLATMDEKVTDLLSEANASATKNSATLRKNSFKNGTF